MIFHRLKLRQYILSVKRKVNCWQKIIFSFAIFCLVFIFPYICEGYYYQIGDQTDDILYFNQNIKPENEILALTITREYRFNLSELAITGLQFEYKMWNSNNVFDLFSSGNDVYQENRLRYRLSVYNSFSHLNIGFSLNQIAVKGYESITSGCGIVAGGITLQQSWKFSTGGIFCFDRSDYLRNPDNKIWLSVSTEIRHQTLICGALTANPYSVASLSIGMREKLSNLLSVRVSLVDNPVSWGGAILLTHKRFDYEFMTKNMPPLGWVNRVGISFK